jgi:hypothetical protein
MRNFIKMLPLVLMVVLFATCGNGGEDFSYTKHQITTGYTYSTSLIGEAGSNQRFLDPVYLYEIIGEEAAKKLTNAEFVPDSFYVEIVGLKAMETKPVLTNVVLTLIDRRAIDRYPDNPPTRADRETFELGNFNSDKKLLGGPASFFFDTLFFFYNYGVKEPILIVSFYSTESITRDDNVKLNIAFKGTYHYIEIDK